MAAAGFGLATMPALASDPSGTWLTQDGRARIRTEKCGVPGDKLCGYVVWLQKPLDDKGAPRTDVKNPDPRKRSRPSVGVQLIEGLKLNGDGRYEGQIYNGDDGKKYDVTIWSEEPGTLSVKGCLVAFLCSTQSWARVTDTVPGQLAGATGSPTGPRPEPGWGKTLASAPMAQPARKPADQPAH